VPFSFAVKDLPRKPRNFNSSMNDLETPWFPTELLDKIIDECIWDNKTLLACALVNHAFRELSLPHLFQKVVLTDLETGKVSNLASTSAEALIQFMKSAPHLLNYIRVISISCHRDAQSWFQKSSRELAYILTSIPSPVSFLLQIVSGVSRSSRLSWPLLSSEFKGALIDLFRSTTLRTISICGLVAFPITLFNEFSSSVDRLALMDSDPTTLIGLPAPPDQALMPHNSSITKTKLKELYLVPYVDERGMKIYPSMQWLLTPDCRLDLSQLAMLYIAGHWPYSTTDEANFLHILHMLSKSLKHLSFHGGLLSKLQS
jgi:hypothetical protein